MNKQIEIVVAQNFILKMTCLRSIIDRVNNLVSKIFVIFFLLNIIRTTHGIAE